MARIMRKGKVLLAYIKDRRARRVSYRQRSKSFVRLVSELCILCGVDGCAIVCGPYPDLKPEVWPTDQPELQHVLMNFNNISLAERNMNMLNHRSFLNNQITKLDDKSQKQERENRKEELSKIVRQALNGKRSPVNRSDLGDLNKLVAARKKEIEQAITELKTPGLHSIPDYTNNTNFTISYTSIPMIPNPGTNNTISYANLGNSTSITMIPNPSTNNTRSYAYLGNNTAITMIPNPSTNHARSDAYLGYGIDNGFEINGGVNGGVVDYTHNNQGSGTIYINNKTRRGGEVPPLALEASSYGGGTLENIINNNSMNQKMMEGGIPPPAMEASFGGGTLEDIVNNVMRRQ
ncbi:hypothetical protein MKW92_039269 [Papaver armeniacum]|nr:hypothetical protein MKW92_039269 [Papaver armeniacum]